MQSFLSLPGSEPGNTSGQVSVPSSVAGNNSVTLEVVNSDTEDVVLLAQIAHGNTTAFHTFYRRQAPKILGMLRKHSRDSQVANEIMQDVFLSVWNKATAYQPERGVPGQWLWGIARNRLADHWRRIGRLGREVGCDFEIMPIDGDDVAISKELEITLKTAVSQLSPAERDLVEQVYFQGHTLDSASQASGIPLGTVKWRIQAALKSLRIAFHSKDLA